MHRIPTSGNSSLFWINPMSTLHRVQNVARCLSSWAIVSAGDWNLMHFWKAHRWRYFHQVLSITVDLFRNEPIGVKLDQVCVQKLILIVIKSEICRRIVTSYTVSVNTTDTTFLFASLRFPQQWFQWDFLFSYHPRKTKQKDRPNFSNETFFETIPTA